MNEQAVEDTLKRIRRAEKTRKKNNELLLSHLSKNGMFRAHCFADGRCVCVTSFVHNEKTYYGIMLLDVNTRFVWRYVNQQNRHTSPDSAACEARQIFGITEWNTISS